MSAGHNHADGDGAHGHAMNVGADNQRRVAIAALITGLFMVVEVVGGLLSGSLALLADAGHMLIDFIALSLAWIAFRVSDRPVDARRSYGFDRVQILVAFVNGLTLFVIAGWIIVEAVDRMFNPVEVLGTPMLIVATAGLVVNLLAFIILHGADRGNLNIRGAAMHVMGDLLGSVAAIGAAGIIILTGWMPADPILSVLVALLVLRGAWVVVRGSGHILLEGAPDGFDGDLVAKDLAAHIGGVENVHHVHAWSITQERPMITLHARIRGNANPEPVRAAIKARLAERFSIAHATVEIEHGRCADKAG